MIFWIFIGAILLFPAFMGKILGIIFWLGFVSMAGYLAYTVYDPVATQGWLFTDMAWYWYPVAPLIAGIGSCFMLGFLIGFSD